jgi:adenylate cyclase
MTTTGGKRKLIAILSADVKGYSHLMADDDEATVETLTAYRQVMTEVIEKHRGRVVDSPGDNLLAEFASVVDAMRGAVEIQEELRARNAELLDHRRMEFRIGINLGDVIEEGGRIYGDGVNIAARVEGLADAGGICLSESAYQQVKNKLSLGIEYLGEHAVKNISEPVPVYRLVLEPRAVDSPATRARRVKPSPWKKWAVPAIFAVIVAAVAVGLWQFFGRLATPPLEVASIERMAFPLPDKPSLAVLPFDNLSGHPAQDYLSDGLTEDIITALSKVTNLFVIARHSTFTYKGKAVKVQQVSEELGVRYVLEGSVQKAGDRVRITAQLVDATTGTHLWAERYDRDLRDVFAVQDAITRKIVEALEVTLTEGEQARVWHRSASNLKATEYYRRSREHFLRFTKAENALARQLKEKALALDPQFALGWAGLAWTHWLDARFGWSESPAQSRQLAEELTHKALDLDDSIASAYQLLSRFALVERQYDQAIAYVQKAVAVSPSDAAAVGSFARILLHAGRPEEAVWWQKRAMRLSPFYPAVYLAILGRAYFVVGRHEEAITAFQSLLERQELGTAAHRGLAMVYSELGRDEDARAQAAELLKLRPTFSVERWAKTRYPYKDPSVLERMINALRQAGLK